MLGMRKERENQPSDNTPSYMQHLHLLFQTSHTAVTPAKQLSSPTWPVGGEVYIHMVTSYTYSHTWLLKAVSEGSRVHTPIHMSTHEEKTTLEN